MKRLLGATLIVALLVVPVAAVAKGGRGDGDGGGKQRSFGGNLRGEAAVTCVGTDCGVSASGTTKGSLGKGEYTASVTFSTIDPVQNDDGFDCYAVTGGSMSVSAEKGSITGTVVAADSQVCDATETKGGNDGATPRYKYRVFFDIAEGSTAKGKTGTGGFGRYKGQWRPGNENYEDKGQIKGKLTL